MIASAGLAPRIAQPVASIAPTGTSTSAIQVSASATCGTSSIATTTNAIETGASSAQPRLLKRFRKRRDPAAREPHEQRLGPIRKLLAIRKSRLTCRES